MIFDAENEYEKNPETKHSHSPPYFSSVNNFILNTAMPFKQLMKIFFSSSNKKRKCLLSTFSYYEPPERRTNIEYRTASFGTSIISDLNFTIRFLLFNYGCNEGTLKINICLD